MVSWTQMKNLYFFYLFTILINKKITVFVINTPFVPKMSKGFPNMAWNKMVAYPWDYNGASDHLVACHIWKSFTHFGTEGVIWRYGHGMCFINQSNQTTISFSWIYFLRFMASQDINRKNTSKLENLFKIFVLLYYFIAIFLVYVPLLYGTAGCKLWLYSIVINTPPPFITML